LSLADVSSPFHSGNTAKEPGFKNHFKSAEITAKIVGFGKGCGKWTQVVLPSWCFVGEKLFIRSYLLK
jgi:hypothetical protein